MKKEVGEEEGKGNAEGCSPEGEHVGTGSFVLRLLSLSYRREPELEVHLPLGTPRKCQEVVSEPDL